MNVNRFLLAGFLTTLSALPALSSDSKKDTESSRRDEPNAPEETKKPRGDLHRTRSLSTESLIEDGEVIETFAPVDANIPFKKRPLAGSDAAQQKQKSDEKKLKQSADNILRVSLEKFDSADHMEQEIERCAAEAKKGDKPALAKLVSIAKTHNARTAQFYIGKHYHDKGDIKRALLWYDQAALQQHTGAQNMQGVIHLGDKDYARAFPCFLLAADQGNLPEAQYYLGNMYFKGQGVSKDLAKAKEYFTKSSHRGFIFSQFKLGQMLTVDSSDVATYQTGVELLELAEKNNETINRNVEKCKEEVTKLIPETQFKLALMYLQGTHGAQKNSRLAARYLLRASNRSNREAQFTFGRELLVGVLKSESPIESNSTGFLQLKKAANAGHEGAKLLHAEMLLKSLEDKLEAADLQLAKAVHPKDFLDVIELYKKATHDGNKQKAQEKIAGVHFRMGELCVGPMHNLNEAIKHFQEATNLGHGQSRGQLANAQESLAQVCITAKNYERAIEWSNLAVHNGSERAKVQLRKAKHSLIDSYLQANTLESAEKALKYLETNKIDSPRAHDLLCNAQYQVAKKLLESVNSNSRHGQMGKLVDRGVDLLNKVAEAKHPLSGEAQFDLGQLYYSGCATIVKDWIKSIQWFKASAASGHARARELLGEVQFKQGKVHYGDHTKRHFGSQNPDFAAAIKMFEEAKDNRHGGAQEILPHAYFEYATAFCSGKGVAKNYDKAVEYLDKAAGLDHAGAQFKLAEMYHDGKAIKKDTFLAEKWMAEAASHQVEGAIKLLPSARVRLGEALLKAEDEGPKNDVEALKLFELAHIANHKRAGKLIADVQYKMGMGYLKGIGGYALDVAKAMDMLTKSSALHEGAQAELKTVKYEMACSHLEAGERFNPARAAELLAEIEVGATEEAKFKLASLHVSKHVFAGKNPSRGLSLYEQLATGGHEVASRELSNIVYQVGQMYFYGSGGIAQDYSLAFDYFNKLVKLVSPKNDFDNLSEHILHSAQWVAAKQLDLTGFLNESPPRVLGLGGQFQSCYQEALLTLHTGIDFAKQFSGSRVPSEENSNYIKIMEAAQRLIKVQQTELLAGPQPQAMDQPRQAAPAVGNFIDLTGDYDN
jgi:TPR repeat protein